MRLDEKEGTHKSTAHHPEEMCEKCRQLGYYCRKFETKGR